MLYEGYVLYPYRASALKNSMRWQFGVIEPGNRLGTTVVIEADTPSARLGMSVRFLRPCRRRPLDSEQPQPWDEGVDDEWTLESVDLGTTRGAGPHTQSFRRPAVHETGRHQGTRVVRAMPAVEMSATVTVREVARHLVAEIVIGNRTVVETGTDETGRRRGDLAPGSVVGLHLLLWVDGGSFVSVTDPPLDAAAVVESARGEGLYPVLVGSLGTSDVALALPIILYDDPHIAAESQRPMFDATEIDELLALRVLTLTDEEKRLARATDARTSAIVEHVMGLSPQMWATLHGTERPAGAFDPDADARFDPFTTAVAVDGKTLKAGSRVRLRPSSTGDLHDMFVTGREATVRGVFTDIDGGVMLAVTIDGDPAAELQLSTGRFRYFHCDEVDALDP